MIVSAVSMSRESRSISPTRSEPCFIAAVVLPLLGLLIFFRDYITSWVGENANNVRGTADQYNGTF